jgi:hypothetical protein
MASDAEVDLLVNASGALADVERQLNALVQRAERDADPITLAAALNSRASTLAVRSDLNDVIRRAQAAAPDITITADVDDADRDSRRLTNTFGQLSDTAGTLLGSLGSVAGSVARVGAASAAALPLIAGVAVAIESILPAAAVSTSAMLTMVVASTTLKLGMQGVGAAVDAAFDPDTKPEELAKAMEALAPEAREFVKELAGMKGGFKALQLDVQNRLFEGLDKQVKRVARSTLPALERGVDSAASSFNAMARGVADAAVGLADSGVLGSAIRSSENALRSLEQVPSEAASSFVRLAAAAGPSMERLADKAADVSTRVAESLARGFESGALQDAINAAVDNLAQLGRIGGNVLGGLGNIISGLSVDGQGLFRTLEDVTGAFEELTGSTEFQDALGALSGVFFKVTEALQPVLDLAVELALMVLPILTKAFEFVGEVVERLAPFIEQLADNIKTQLEPVLSELPGIMDQILPKFLDLADQILPKLLDVMAELGPKLGEAAVAFADLLVELTPLLVKFLEFQSFLIDKLAPVIGPLASLILDVLLGAFQGLAEFVSGTVIPVVRSISALLEGDFNGALAHAGGAVNSFRDLVSRAFSSLHSRVTSLIGQVASVVLSAVHRLVGGSIQGFSQMVHESTRLIASLPGRILSALGNLHSLLFSAGQSIVRGLINGITSQIGSLVSTLSNITSMIPDLKGPLEVDRVLLTPAGEQIMQGLIRGMQSQLPALRKELSGVTGMFPSIAGPKVAGIGAQLAAPQQPTVNVYLGNQRLTGFVDSRIDSVNRRDTRALAQGVRR